MGHSFGGLFAQILLDRGLGAAGVAIGSAPVKGLLLLPFSTLKSSFPALSNPANFHKATPPSLIEMNYQLYKRSKAITDYKEFPAGTHFMLGDTGWEQVADFALDWAAQHAKAALKV